MKISEIKVGSVLKHISDFDYNHPPQKLIVTRVENVSEDHEGDSVRCEWFNKMSGLQKEWFNHKMLEKW